MRRKFAVAAITHVELVPVRSVQHPHGSCPGFLLHCHPIFVGIPSQDVLQHHHVLGIPQEVASFPHEPCGVDDILREQIDELQEFVVRLGFEEGLQTLKEVVGLRRRRLYRRGHPSRDRSRLLGVVRCWGRGLLGNASR